MSTRLPCLLAPSGTACHHRYHTAGPQLLSQHNSGSLSSGNFMVLQRQTELSDRGGFYTQEGKLPSTWRSSLSEGWRSFRSSISLLLHSSLGVTTGLFMFIWFVNALTYYGEVLLTTTVSLPFLVYLSPFSLPFSSTQTLPCFSFGSHRFYCQHSALLALGMENFCMGDVHNIYRMNP